jgi:hypothetical protein
MFDRMVAARENGRRMLRKEAERFTRRQGDDPDEPTESQERLHGYRKTNRRQSR